MEIYRTSSLSIFRLSTAICFSSLFSLPLNVSYLSMGISSFFSHHFPLILFPSNRHMFLLFTRENILIIRNFSDFFIPPLWISCSPLSAENMQYRLFQIPETQANPIIQVELMESEAVLVLLLASCDLPEKSGYYNYFWPWFADDLTTCCWRQRLI